MVRFTLMASLVVSLAGPAGAAFYDAASDFSPTSNPNGVWSYGYETTLGGPLILNEGNGSSLNGSGLEYRNTPLSLDNPLAAYNPTATVIDYTTVIIQPGQLFLHPGPQDQFETVRFTAPEAETLQLSAGFIGIDGAGTTSDVHILQNGVSLFSGLINGYGNAKSYSDTVVLAVGDTLDFSVGYGSNMSFFNDSTAVSVQLASVPEPGALSLASAGMIVLAAARIIRRPGKKAA